MIVSIAAEKRKLNSGGLKKSKFLIKWICTMPNKAKSLSASTIIIPSGLGQGSHNDECKI